MNIELRKIKITASILKQLQIASENQMKTYAALGYVLYKDRKRILLYDEVNQTLCYMYFFDAKVITDQIQIDSHGTREQQWKVELTFFRGGYYITSFSNNEIEANELYTQVEARKREANTIGQIYF